MNIFDVLLFKFAWLIKEFFYNFDLDVLYFINHTLSNGFFDIVLPLLRNKFIWIPLYVFVVFVFIKKYRQKSLVLIGLTLLLLILSDQISSSLIKPYFHRLRPCNNPELSAWLQLPIGKGSGWSFVSSHATNHFALAYFFSFFIFRANKKLYVPVLFYIWAGLIAFSQVYVGFHYPSDVFTGAVLGTAIAYFISKICCKYLKLN
ncbi:MAG: phosphatase PAP2 family protein [Bacteroidetes bacterium]|nr:phosphatase PAP2 family protein [Bacteroidota bacterium]